MWGTFITRTHPEIPLFSQYFDRGIYDMQTCPWKTGCLRGAPTIMENERQRVCCCVPCCKCYNQFTECYAPSFCGERIRVIPHETCCCCCSNRANCCSNCCGLSGLATGEPLFVSCCLVSGLIDGEAAKLAYALNFHRAKWVERTNAVRR